MTKKTGPAVERGTERVSIIIPTLNGGRRFEELLTRLFEQSRVPEEVLVIDSSSTDTTPETAKNFNVTLMSIGCSDFDHGGTRTMAARAAKGNILVFLTQDAVFTDSDDLEKLLIPLQEERVAVSYGRQLPSPDATCFASHLRTFNYPEKSHIRCWEDREQHGFRAAFTSNSFAAYRRSPLQEVGFFEDGLIFGEDSCTVAKLLQKGYCVAYAADARVYHSHNYTLGQDFRRYFDVGVFHSCKADLLREFGSPTGEGRRFVLSEFRQLMQSRSYLKLPESILRNSLKFLAYKLGKNHTLLPRKLAVQCSMNRQWWSHKKRDV